MASIWLGSLYYERKLENARTYLRETYLRHLMAHLENSEEPSLKRLLWCLKNNYRYPNDDNNDDAFKKYQKWFCHLHERVFNGTPLPQYFLYNMGVLNIRSGKQFPEWVSNCVDRYTEILRSKFWSEEEILPIAMSINAIIDSLETHHENHPDIVVARTKLEAFLDGFNIDTHMPKAMKIFELAMADK
jgi:hypothetical protein